MTNRLQIEPRNFTLPDLNNDSPTSSPLFASRKNNMNSNSYHQQQFVLPAQAFVPIKDSHSAAQRDAKRKEMESVIQQQTKMQEKLKELEAEMNNLKRLRELPALGGTAEHALRNATDMTLYLTKKLQDMHEAITKVEVRLQQQEKKLNEERGGLSAIAEKVVELETGCEEKLVKQLNEMTSLRDSLQEMRAKLNNEQTERKSAELKFLERLNRQKEEFMASRQPILPPPQQTNLSNSAGRLEERMARLEQEMARNQSQRDVRPQKDHGPDVDKIKADIENLKRQLETEAKKTDARKWSELTKQLEEELADLHQSVKTDRMKTHQELKSLKESLSAAAEAEVDRHKSMQEKLQAEILTRQQFECDTLRQMTTLDDKLIRIGSSFNLPNMKGSNSGKSELVIKEVDSLKKLIVHTEKNLELKIEDSISKLKPAGAPSVEAPRDVVKRQELEDLERNLQARIERGREQSERSLKVLDESVADWRSAADRSIKEIKRELEELRVDGSQAASTARRDNEALVELNKRVLKMDESIDDYKVFKEVTNDSLEDLRRRMKSLAGQKPRSPPANKEKGVDDTANQEWREQVDASLDEIQKNVKTNKEKVLQNEVKLNSLKKEVHEESANRIAAIEEVKELIKNLPPPTDRAVPEQPKSNSAKEGLKRLANALQGTKNLLAMKMQHEMKERENAVGYLTKRVDDLDSTVEDMDDRLHKLENDTGPDDDTKRPDSQKDADKNSAGKSPADDKEAGAQKENKKPKKKEAENKK